MHVELNGGKLRLWGKLDLNTKATLGARAAGTQLEDSAHWAVAGPSLTAGAFKYQRAEMTELEKFFSLDMAGKQAKMCCWNYRRYQKYISGSFFPPMEIITCFPESVTWLEGVLKPVFKSLSTLALVPLNTWGSLSLWIEFTWDTSHNQDLCVLSSCYGNRWEWSPVWKW